MMFEWLFMVIPLYFTYYTVMYAIVVWKKERNITACIMIGLLALSLTVLPIWLKIRKTV